MSAPRDIWPAGLVPNQLVSCAEPVRNESFAQTVTKILFVKLSSAVVRIKKSSAASSWTINSLCGSSSRRLSCPLATTLMATFPVRSTLLVHHILFSVTLSVVRAQDWKSKIPAEDAGNLKPEPDVPSNLYQGDLMGCKATVNPACSLQTVPVPYPKSSDGFFVLPFALAPEINADLQGNILDAFASIEEATGCIKTYSKDELTGLGISGNNPTLLFNQSAQCAAEFGGPKLLTHAIYLNDNCLQGKMGNIQRLIMLALGFPHEHVRFDRDDNIVVNLDNVIPSRKIEFTKLEQGMVYADAYDLDSVLQPGYMLSAKDSGAPTMYAKSGKRIGQREKISTGDAQKIKRLICEGTGPSSQSQPVAVKVSPESSVPAPTDSSAVVITKYVPKGAKAGKVPPTTTPPGDDTCADGDDCEDIPTDAPAIAPTPTRRCAEGESVIMKNTQTMSRTTILSDRTVFSHFTKRSNWWYIQDNANEPTAHIVEYPDFAGSVKTVQTSVVNDFTTILQTQYQPKLVSETESRLQRKFETRITQCSKARK